MKTLFSLFLFCTLAKSVFATPQIADQLLLENGTTIPVHYFSLSDTARENLEAWKAKKGHDGNFSTGNYDGFYARLQIKEGQLYLTRIEVDAHSFLRGSHHAKVPLSAIFAKKEPLVADWFSGKLYAYFGEDIGYTGVKSNASVYVFKKGRLVEMKVEKFGRK